MFPLFNGQIRHLWSIRTTTKKKHTCWLRHRPTMKLKLLSLEHRPLTTCLSITSWGSSSPPPPPLPLRHVGPQPFLQCSFEPARFCQLSSLFLQYFSKWNFIPRFSTSLCVPNMLYHSQTKSVRLSRGETSQSEFSSPSNIYIQARVGNNGFKKCSRKEEREFKFLSQYHFTGHIF